MVGIQCLRFIFCSVFFGGKLAELFWGEAAISKAYCYWILRLRNFKLFCNKIKILGLIGIDVWLILFLILWIIYFDDKVNTITASYTNKNLYGSIIYRHAFQTRYSLCLNFFIFIGLKFDCLNGKNGYFFRNLWDFWTENKKSSMWNLTRTTHTKSGGNKFSDHHDWLRRARENFRFSTPSTRFCLGSGS